MRHIYTVAVFLLLMALTLQSCSKQQEPLGAQLLEKTSGKHGAVVCSGKHLLLLSKMAESHVLHMAESGMISHEGFASRAKVIYDEIGGNASEICAEANQLSGQSAEDAIHLLWKAWKSSPRHWAVASSIPEYWGGAVAKGESEIWYGCIITSDAMESFE